MVKFRELELSSGKKVLCGKNSSQNEELVKKFLGKENIIFHSVASGSPFCVIIDEEKVKRKEKKETAIICARYSQDWRDNKSDVNVHWFKGKYVYKEKKMAVGTFGVKKSKTIKVKKKNIDKFIENN